MVRPTVRPLRLTWELHLGAGPASSPMRLEAELKTGHQTTLARACEPRELLASRLPDPLPPSRGLLARDTHLAAHLARPPCCLAPVLPPPHRQHLRLISTRHCTHEAAISTSFAAPITSRPSSTRPQPARTPSISPSLRPRPDQVMARRRCPACRSASCPFDI